MNRQSTQRHHAKTYEEQDYGTHTRLLIFIFYVKGQASRGEPPGIFNIDHWSYSEASAESCKPTGGRMRRRRGCHSTCHMPVFTVSVTDPLATHVHARHPLSIPALSCQKLGAETGLTLRKEARHLALPGQCIASCIGEIDIPIRVIELR